MPKSRVEIQADVNIYRAGVENKDLELNDPIWDDKCDPRYLGIKKARDDEYLKVMGSERELAEAKARGEKGRSLTEICEEISKTQLLVNDYRSLLSKTDKNVLQWMMIQQSASLLQCIVNALQRELVEAFIDRGFEYSGKGEHDKAIADCAQAILLDPNNVEAYYLLGIAYYDKGDFDRAITSYDKAIQLKPDLAVIYINRGKAYKDKGVPDKAIADYSQAIRIDPNNAMAYTNRGVLYAISEGTFAMAIDDFNAALRIDPNDAHAKRGLESILKILQMVNK